MDGWDLDSIERLIKKLSESKTVVAVEDVIWLLDKLADPDDPDQKYFRELVAA